MWLGAKIRSSHSLLSNLVHAQLHFKLSVSPSPTGHKGIRPILLRDWHSSHIKPCRLRSHATPNRIPCQPNWKQEDHGLRNRLSLHIQHPSFNCRKLHPIPRLPHAARYRFRMPSDRRHGFHIKPLRRRGKRKSHRHTRIRSLARRPTLPHSHGPPYPSTQLEDHLPHLRNSRPRDRISCMDISAKHRDLRSGKSI